MKRLSHWEDLLTGAMSSGGAFGTTSHSELVRLIDALRSILRDIDRELTEIEARSGRPPEKSE